MLTKIISPNDPNGRHLFLERGEGEREGDKHQCVVDSHPLPNEDLAHN